MSEIIKKVYSLCPYCNRFESLSEEEVLEHMKTCSYNPNLPEKDCPTCKHKWTYSEYEPVGRAGGKRPIMKVSHSACHKGLDVYNSHYGYHACEFYEKREEN